MEALIDFFVSGGPVMYLILLCSLVALFITVERLLALRRARAVPDGFINELRGFIRKGDVKSAVLYVTRYDVPIARVIKRGLQKLHHGHLRVQQAMEEQGREEAGRLEKRMGILATMAGVAPLLGFLGTVVGIALAFNDIAEAGGEVSPDKLADGISIALNTTVFGLTIGIPAFAAYNYLSSLIQSAIGELEGRAREFFDAVEEELPSDAVSKSQVADALSSSSDGAKP